VALDFVGSHLVDVLAKSGHDVVVVDNFFLGKMSNIRDAINQHHVKLYREDATHCLLLRSILEIEGVDMVFNLAMKCLPTSFIDPEGAYMIGVQIAHNLAYLLREKVYKKLVHFSSSEAYGSAVRVPMDEQHPTDPTIPYSAGKLAADLLLMSYHKTFDLDIGIVRPFNLIGPRQNWNLYAAVVPLTIMRILEGARPFITGDGLQTRDFTYVTDVTGCVASLVEEENFSKLRGRVVNFGQGRERTIKEVVETVCLNMQYPLSKIEYRPPRAGDVLRHFADITLAKNLFDYAPRTPFHCAINRTVEWFRKCDLAAQ
jgi:UDP-glucose 4-epimerase